jgi:hypothetical protein
MKFKGKYINRNRSVKNETKPDENIKTVAETIIKTIRNEPIIKGNGLSKQEKIERIKNIVLKDEVNNKSIERLNKFINFSIKYIFLSISILL